MIKEKLLYLLQDLRSFSSKEKKFTLFAMAVIFGISLEYSITRPASVSLFLHYFGAEAFPYVWLFTVPVNFATISFYNYLLPRIGCKKTWLCIALITVFINTLTLLLIDSFPLLSFIQFLWKDIYILLMYKQIWSLIHSTVPFNRAKYLYGVIFSMGGFAAIAGGTIPGFFATHLGSKTLFMFTLPIYLLLCFLYFKVNKYSEFKYSFTKNYSLFSSFKKFNYLIFILLIVISMQISVAFVEYKFNLFLEKSIADVDLRTAYTGKLLTAVHSFEIVLQLIGGFVLINFFGVKNLHLIIPLTLFANSLLFIFLPTLTFASYLYVYIKSLDFSIFGMVREMLYLPMKTEERFKVKAFIDVFAQRSAKALAGFFVIFFHFFKIPDGVTIFSLLIFIFWIICSRNLFKSDFAYQNLES